MPGSRELKQQFRSSVRRGRGEAYLLLRNNPTIDFSSEITKACVKNFTYDGQCESSRAPYLYELILLSGKEKEIKAAVLNSLANNHSDTWTLVQLFELAKLYAQNGHDDARIAISARFMKYPSSRADWAGYREVIDLNGFDGLRTIASKMGEALQNDADEWQDGAIIKYFQDENPGIDAWHELEDAGKNDPFIKTYLDNVRETTKTRERTVLPEVTYSDIVEEVLLTKRRSSLLYRKWTKRELMLIAERLVTEKNKHNRAKLLRVFRKNKFPLNSDIILNIAKGETKADLSYIACDALGHLRSDNIRDFAVEKIAGSKTPQKYTIILKANYKKGDYKLLTELIHRTNNDVLLELLMINILEIYRFNKTKECVSPLEALYNRSACAIHRYNVVELLIENNVLSSKIKNELIFDCDEDVRKLAVGLADQATSND